MVLGYWREYIKPTALANVHAFYQQLKPEIQIVGTGGVLTGRDAFDIFYVVLVWFKLGLLFIKEGPVALNESQLNCKPSCF